MLWSLVLILILLVVAIRRAPWLAIFSPVLTIGLTYFEEILKGVAPLLIGITYIAIFKIAFQNNQEKKVSALAFTNKSAGFFILLILVETFFHFRNNNELAISWVTMMLWASMNFGYIAYLTGGRNRQIFLWVWSTSAATISTIAVLTGDLGASRSGSVLGMPTNTFAIFVSLGVISAISLLQFSQQTTRHWKSLSVVITLGILGVGNSGSTSGAVLIVLAIILLIKHAGLRMNRLFYPGPFLATLLLFGTFVGVKFDPFNNSQRETRVVASVSELNKKESTNFDVGRPLLESRNLEERSSSAGDRISLIKGHVHKIIESPILGYGSLDVPLVDVIIFNETSTIPQAAHNSFISLVEAYGLLGFIPMSLFLLFLFLKRRRGNRFFGLILGIFATLCVIDIQWTYLIIPVSMALGFFSNENEASSVLTSST